MKQLQRAVSEALAFFEGAAAFKIPPKLKPFMLATQGDLGNAKNWKAKVSLANSGDKNDTGVRYIMIDTTSNLIVPVAMGDEHWSGNELLRHYQTKGFVPRTGKWVPVNSWGNNYVVAEDAALMLAALKKFVQYGGDAAQPLYTYGNDDLGSIQQFIDGGGTLETPKVRGINISGSKIIDFLEKVSKDYLVFTKLEDKHRQPTADQVEELFSYTEDQLRHIWLDWTKPGNPIQGFASDALEEVELARGKTSDPTVATPSYHELFRTILSGNGFKNKLHNALKRAKEGDSAFRDFTQTFGDIPKAIEELNRLGRLQ